MNIGYDGSRAFIGNKTGTENYSIQILKNLVLIDHTNKYYIYLRPGSFSQGLALRTQGQALKTLPYPRLWTQVGLAKQTFKDKLDVLFIPAHTIPLIRKPGLKTVVTVHDLGVEYLPKTHQLKQRLYLNLMTHHQLKSATHIIAVSETTKDDLIKKVGIPEKKITVIYEGYDKDKFKIQNSKFKINQSIKQYNLSYHDYFLFVGTIQPRKNLTRLITAYAHFLNQKPIIHNTDPLPQLVLAGSKGWLSDEIYKLPKKLGIEEHVKFLGYIPDEKLPALYSGAKAFLFPSLFEGFGLPVLEAMACGCPVLTSNTSSMPEIVSRNLEVGNGKWDIEFLKPEVLDNQETKISKFQGQKHLTSHIKKSSFAAILVDPYSVEDITKGISELTMNHELTNKLTKLGLEQVKKFSWEKAAEETLIVLEKVAKS